MEALPRPPLNPDWRRIVERILTVWSGYQLGLQQQSDSAKDKHEWFGDEIAGHVANGRAINADGLEEWMDQILYQDFDLVLEDNSTFPTANFLVQAHGYWKSGERAKLTQLLESLPSEERVKEAQRESRLGAEQSDEEGIDGIDEDGESGEEGGEGGEGEGEGRPKRERPPRNVVDDDGWTTVSKR